ncbi:hypothetical protein [Calidithermus chliarophilus]|uniref:hypothetical protein n=1 Tax=Calidithermus chliarophilus TaxID=52023 RepID=UPI001FE16EBE|nr:hypothetical protein [Calidithermus chliarophilus]
MRKRLKFSRVEVSYPEAAANHGRLEVGVIFPDRERHRAVPVAVGGQATQIRKHPPGEEGFLALVGLDASAEMVSPRGKPAAGVARAALPQGWLLLWEVLGEDPRDFPLGKAEARRQAIHRIRRDILSRPFARERGKKTPAKKQIGRDNVSQGKRQNPVTKHPAYTDLAVALAAELGG